MSSGVILDPIDYHINILEAIKALQAFDSLTKARGEGSKGGGSEAGSE